MATEFWKQLLAYIGGVSTILFIAGWLIKTWLEHKIKSDVDAKYEKELEKFKQELIAEKTKELEQFKSQLETRAAESNYRYSLYYKATTEAVININKAIVNAQSAISFCLDLSLVNHAEKASAENAAKALTELSLVLIHGKLYLNPKCDKLAWEIQTYLGNLFQTFGMYYRQFCETCSCSSFNEREMQAVRENHQSLCRMHHDSKDAEYKEAFGQLQSEFRLLLGFKDNAESTKKRLP